MKEFKLSTVGERITGVTFSAGVLIILAALLVALRDNLPLLIFCGLSTVLICILLVIYCRSVLKAAAIVDAEKKQLHVRGIRNETYDLQDAVLLQTFARRNGQSTVRLLIFSDKNEDIIASVPTMFTSRLGIWADPVAKEIAAEMGIEFKQTVPDWQFDKEKYREHIKEEAAREKAENKERRQKRKQDRINKRKNMK